jgi:hypothetical protein
MRFPKFKHEPKFVVYHPKGFPGETLIYWITSLGDWHHAQGMHAFFGEDLYFISAQEVNDIVDRYNSLMASGIDPQYVLRIASFRQFDKHRREYRRLYRELMGDGGETEEELQETGTTPLLSDAR